mgnify:FL=1
MKIAGGCYCGEIRFEAEGALEAAFQCHCRECQYITGRNPNTVTVFAQRDFRYISRNPAKFARTDLPTPVERYFCQDCGTAIGSISPSRPNSMIVKVGTLDDPSVFTAKAAIFTCDQQSFHHVQEGLPSFDKRPPKKS